MNIETINSVKGNSYLKQLKGLNNELNAYMLVSPLHITVKKSYDDKHKNLVYIEGFGSKIEVGEKIHNFEHLGTVEYISFIGDNKFIITFKNNEDSR